MKIPSGHEPPLVELETLVKLFYDTPSQLGTFQAVDGQDVPQPYRQLLVHHAHMTVTVEAFHQQQVDVEVLRYAHSSDMYQREIRLRGRRSQTIVQYGIVRLKPQLLQANVWEAIDSRILPLGRVLIEHGVLREVECLGLWQIDCGPSLAKALECAELNRTYGRTAMIYCDGQPAIELLEIVAPIDPTT